MVDSPTSALLNGTVGDPLYVLTLPEVRGAEEVATYTSVVTADGTVGAHPGDFIVKPDGGEPYPVRRDVFFGAYKILGRVGRHLVAERLIHLRRAWPILEDEASFDYGAERGTVPIARDGWLYQSDDNDFGVINREVKHDGHAEIGREADVRGYPWARRHDIATAMLASMPPMLALLALLALYFSDHGWAWLRVVFLVAETLLLLAGAAVVVWLRKDRWLLKACVSSGLDLCRRFQVAVQLLGYPPSSDFPGMTLWRFAQLDTPPPPLDLGCQSVQEFEKQLKREIALTIGEVRERMERDRTRELLVNWGSGLTLLLIFFINLHALAVPGAVRMEVLAIWLPSLVSAAHSFNFRRRTTDRLAALREFMAHLRFVQTRLFEDVPSGHSMNPHAENRAANLRLLCRLVAQHSQRELLFTLANEQPLPV
jgi:hypothetical protein